MFGPYEHRRDIVSKAEHCVSDSQYRFSASSPTAFWNSVLIPCRFVLLFLFKFTKTLKNMTLN